VFAWVPSAWALPIAGDDVVAVLVATKAFAAFATLSSFASSLASMVAIVVVWWVRMLPRLREARPVFLVVIWVEEKGSHLEYGFILLVCCIGCQHVALRHSRAHIIECSICSIEVELLRSTEVANLHEARLDVIQWVFVICPTHESIERRSV
jgi:ribosomal protein S27E